MAHLHHNASGQGLLIGADLGKVTLKLAVARRGPGGLTLISTTHERHHGRPLELFVERCRELGRSSIAGIAATGIHGGLFHAPVVAGVPEEIAQEYAAARYYPEGPVNVVRLAGRGYSVLARDGSGVVRFEQNDKCSAGAGESIEKICARLGLTLEQALALAESAEYAIPISARCSVFAKTEMTHFANQGEPHGPLLRGYFEGLARNVMSLCSRVKVDGPMVMVGGGALLGPFVRAFRELAGVQVLTPEPALWFEALGALFYLAEQPPVEPTAWPENPADLVRGKARRIHSVPPPSRAAGSVIVLEARKAPDSAPDAPAVLGLDLGSTGAKAAMVDPATGAVIADVYRRTDGNPVEAAQSLVREIMEKCGLPVAAIGLTGSGREAAAVVFRAAYPELANRIIVQNEVIAHAAAAIHLDPDQGQSLSIVEIGGQDAKFINVQDGRVVESDMNRVCSAGTGSFLEEQALAYGLDDVAALGPLAAAAANPPDLGQMCTVFISELAAKALDEGYTAADIMAGFQYSVIWNYCDRVMGLRRFLSKIFFQGKPATDPALARTLAAVTERDVYVPENPGAMGAIGIALLAGRETGRMAGNASFDLAKVIGARVCRRSEFRCRDSGCKNLCRIEAAEVEVAGRREKIVSGGACPKYETSSAGIPKLPREAPNPYRERDDLMTSLLPGPGAVTVGIPRAHYLADYLPFFHAFFTMMGARAEIISSGPETYAVGNRLCTAPDACTPTKIMHGLARPGFDYLFLPKFLNLPRLVEGSGAGTCPMSQATPELVEKALQEEGSPTRIVRPQLRLADGLNSRAFMAELRRVWKTLIRDNRLRPGSGFTPAFAEALRRQQAYEQGLIAIGWRALSAAKREGWPVVLVLGESHVIHEPIMNADIHKLITQNGALALPLDCFPVPADVPPLQRVYWGASNRMIRAALAAARGGSVFPLMIVSHACDPSSFIERIFNDLLENYPHTVLESDGHGGRAGYVTRIQAFLHAARGYRPDGTGADPRKIARLDEFPLHTRRDLERSRIIVNGFTLEAGRHTASIMRAAGLDADALGPSDQAAARAGRAMCTGKECLPYTMHVGAFRRYLEDNPGDGKKLLLYNLTGCGPCRNGMFPLANQIAIEDLGLAGRAEVITPRSFYSDPGISGRKWLSIVAIDLLTQLCLYYRPVEREPGAADALVAGFSDQALAALQRPRAKVAAVGAYRDLMRVREVLDGAARAFAEMPRSGVKPDELRTVFLCGESALRVDAHANDDLARKLNRRGLRVMIEPFGELGEAIAFINSRELVDMETPWLKNLMVRAALRLTRSALVSAVRGRHPWIRWD